MFELIRPRCEVAVPLVISTRDGWHGKSDLRRQDDRILDLPSMMCADEALSALVALQAHRARLDAVEVDLLLRSAGATRVVSDVLVEADPACGDVNAKSRGRVERVEEPPPFLSPGRLSVYAD